MVKSVYKKLETNKEDLAFPQKLGASRPSPIRFPGVYRRRKDRSGNCHIRVEKALCIVNGRLSKRNIVAHEVLAELLGAEDLYRLLQPLLFDHGDSALHFYFKSDSLCSLAMINPQVTLKNTLLDNGIPGFIEEIKKIPWSSQKV